MNIMILKNIKFSYMYKNNLQIVKQEDNILIVPNTINSFIDYLDNNEKLYITS